MAPGIQRLIEGSARNDRVWGAGPREPRKAPCQAAGTLCVVGAKLPEVPLHSFGADPAILAAYPSTEQIARAGSLAGALAANGVVIPAALCCGEQPGYPAGA